MTHAHRLGAMLERSAWHRAVLDEIAASGPPDAWLAAGAVRDLVWDEQFAAGFSPAHVKDVDVVYFDTADLDRARERHFAAQLTRARGDLTWDVTNEAAVHLWYPERFGGDVPPYVSIADAVATFPETATAVAARRRFGRIEILAPLGLDDLFAGIWRCNPARVTLAEARRRISRKEPTTRWPGVTVISP
jgi:hypothetical protein